MPRAQGNDLCEIFGYAPDDYSLDSLQQRASQHCPFVADSMCIKHSHPRKGTDEPVAVYGSCSVVNCNKQGANPEEVIICPQRLYAEEYRTLRDCIEDAFASTFDIYTASQYQQKARTKKLPKAYAVMLGKNSGKEITLERRGTIKLSLDWVFACIEKGKLQSIIPCEVQSIDTTGNYHANWEAYMCRKDKIPNSKHGMNWANVWKRLIPQLCLKGRIAEKAPLCNKGSYFLLPNRVYEQFDKLLGHIPTEPSVGPGILSILTYELGDPVDEGNIRPLVKVRTTRHTVDAFVNAFGSGKTVASLGPVLEKKVEERLAELLEK